MLPSKHILTVLLFLSSQQIILHVMVTVPQPGMLGIDKHTGGEQGNFRKILVSGKQIIQKFRNQVFGNKFERFFLERGMLYAIA